MNICLYCEEELVCWDYFGRIAAHQDGKVFGDIYKCRNEECEAERENITFYTYRDSPDNLIEGYPC
jgi:hypothetical protein